MAVVETDDLNVCLDEDAPSGGSLDRPPLATAPEGPDDDGDGELSLIPLVATAAASCTTLTTGAAAPPLLTCWEWPRRRWRDRPAAPPIPRPC